jgi:hypothetical protein
MKPYDRDDILTCNGGVDADTPPIWFVLIGGSNNYFMLKVILDKLLDLPADAVYDPKLHWNAAGMCHFLLLIQAYSHFHRSVPPMYRLRGYR